MIRRLPPPDKHDDTKQVNLDGREYDLTYLWNARSGRWWFRLDDDEGQICYLPLCAGFPLLLSVTGTRRPPGELFVIDLEAIGGDPSLRDWERFAVVYDDQVVSS